MLITHFPPRLPSPLTHLNVPHGTYLMLFVFYHSFCLRWSKQSPLIAIIPGARPRRSIQRTSTGSDGATEAIQAPHLQ